MVPLVVMPIMLLELARALARARGAGARGRCQRAGGRKPERHTHGAGAFTLEEALEKQRFGGPCRNAALQAGLGRIRMRGVPHGAGDPAGIHWRYRHGALDRRQGHAGGARYRRTVIRRSCFIR